MTEYRLEELAREADTTVRNIRAYRDRGLLPAPRRQGRVALYNDAHLARLRLVADLVARGYTLNSIGELLAAWERGKDISEVLGLEQVLTSPWSDEEPAIFTRDDMAGVLGAPVTDEMIETTVAMGLIEALGEGTGADGRVQETYRVRSLNQLHAGTQLVAAGIPLEAVLEQGLKMHTAMDAIAHDFVQLVSDHLFDPLGRNPSSEDLKRLASTITRLRPVAATVIDAELARAMEHHVQEFLGERLERMLPHLEGEADVRVDAAERS